MDTNLLNRTWISGQPVQVDNLTGTAFTGEAGAHTFIIAGKDVYGNDVPITGEITAKFLASNQVTVPLVGSIGNGSAFITLSDTCYLVPGRFVLSIYATNGNYTTCIYCGVGNVFATSSDITAYPTTATPDLNQLIRDVQAAISSVPADYSALINSIATTFDPQKTGGYGIGEYVWYNGVLYRFKEPHTGGWQASHVDQVILANDLTSVAAVASAGVRYDIGQGLSDTQKATARENIGAQEALTIDAAPTQGSTNPVQSGGVYSEVSGLKSAIENKTLNFLGTITSNNYATILPDLNGLTHSGFYLVNLNYKTTEHPANFPISGEYVGRLDLLACYANPDGYKRQIYYYNITSSTPSVRVFTRGSAGSSWDAWVEIGEDVRTKLSAFDRSGIKSVNLVTSANFATVLPDFNSASSGFYIINLNYGATDIPANAPYTAFYGKLDLLITYRCNDTYGRQVYYSFVNNSSDLRIYSRGRVNNSWDAWTQVDKAFVKDLIGDLFGYKGTLEAGNYQTVMPDANGMITAGYYLLNFALGSTAIPANLPMTAFNGRIDVLICYANSDGYKRQIYYNRTTDGLKIYSRGSGSKTGATWDAWQSIYVDGVVTKIIVDKNGGGDYTSLTEAMRSNMRAGVEFYVRPGEYDLFEEMKAYHGNTYFDDANFNDEGLVIRYGNKVFMDANAIVKFNYEGSNERVIVRFSPFKFGYEGGELHGGQIICSNCRYAIHDDCYTQDYDNRITDGVYIYYRSARNVAIGGGLGKSSHVELKNCYVDSGTVGYGVFYHNNSESDEALNFVSIHDNYFTADIVIEPFGPSTKMSKALVSNNKAKTVRHYQPSATDNPPDIDNFELVAWNNVTTS